MEKNLCADKGGNLTSLVANASLKSPKEPTDTPEKCSYGVEITFKVFGSYFNFIQLLKIMYLN